MYDRYKCRFPPNESSLTLIGDVCSSAVVLDLVYKNKTENARYLGKKTVRNIPVKGWRICKNETAMDFWLVLNTGSKELSKLAENLSKKLEYSRMLYYL